MFFRFFKRIFSRTVLEKHLKSSRKEQTFTFRVYVHRLERVASIGRGDTMAMEPINPWSLTDRVKGTSAADEMEYQVVFTRGF